MSKKKKSEEKIDWFPTMAGNTFGWMPEYYGFNKQSLEWEWMEIPTVKGDRGAPLPQKFRGLLDTIGLMGKAQAQALAYQYQAISESFGDNVEVRVQRYSIVFDIKCRRID